MTHELLNYDIHGMRVQITDLTAQLAERDRKIEAWSNIISDLETELGMATAEITRLREDGERLRLVGREMLGTIRIIMAETRDSVAAAYADAWERVLEGDAARGEGE